MNTYTIDISVSAAANEYVIVELKEPIQDLTKLCTVQFNVSPSTATVTSDYRYSKDGETWSEWRPWPTQDIPDNEFTFLGFRMKADVSVVIESLTLEWLGGELGENGSCTCTVVGCGTSSGDGSFLSNCNSAALYSTALSGIGWWEQLACSVFSNMGWPVIYFKCDEIEESRDVVFREWSLLKVRECKKIKIIVPDNDFGDSDISYMLSDPDFNNDLDIQIHKESFWASFGAGEQPAEKDFLFFPLERRMFRVNSVQAHKGFMRQVQWWKANLIKWNESDSIYKTDEIKGVLDDLTLNFEDVGFEEIKAAEEIDIVKPQQYTTRRIADSDNCREVINTDWELNGVIEENLENFYTVFSKFHYDLDFGVPPIYGATGSTGGTGATGATAEEIQPVVTYQNEVNAEDNFAIMMWYNVKPRTTDTKDEWITLFSEQVNVNIKANETEFTGLQIGDNEFTFNVPVSEWYAIYLGYNKDLTELTLRIWKRKDNASRTTKMEILYESTITPQEFSGSWNVQLMPNGDSIASIRFLKEVMTLENQAPSFNKLVFREDSKAYIIDDCYPMSYLGYMSSR